MKKVLKIFEQRLLLEPSFQSCLNTEQTAMEDDLAAQTGRVQCQMGKRWHSDPLQSNRRSSGGTVMPSCCKRLWLFKVCNCQFSKRKKAELLQNRQAERRRMLFGML